MIGKIFIFLLLLFISIALFILNVEYDLIYLHNGYLTFLAFAGIYFIFKILFEEFISTRISEPKSRYSFRKALSIVYLIIVIITAVAIWVESPEALLVTYGLVAAGIAVSLQDLFKSLAGGIILFVSKPYRVGERIQVGNLEGDVVDIDILYTTVLEIKNWVEGDQATGRLTSIPNSIVLSEKIHNFNKDNQFIWDEIKIPVTYESNWQKAKKLMLETAKKETAEVSKIAHKEIAKIQEKYYFTGRVVEPQVFVKLTDNWIELTVRYVTFVRKRRALRSDISDLLLRQIEKAKDIEIASATISIVKFPK